MPYNLLIEKMKDEINDDNIYMEGTVVCAKCDPGLKLVILKYRQRIYYCAAVGHPEQNKFVYFERELIPPTGSDQQVLFWPIDEPVGADKNYVFKKILA